MENLDELNNAAEGANAISDGASYTSNELENETAAVPSATLSRNNDTDGEGELPREEVEPREGLNASQKVLDNDGLAMRAEEKIEYGEEYGKLKYLSNEQKLDIPTFGAEMVDEDAPFSSFTMAGKWLREAADVRNYWDGIERFGEDIASYKWAYDEGELGEFDGKKFGKEALKAGMRALGQDTLRTTGNLLTMFGANLENGSAATTFMTSGVGAILPQTGKLFKDLGAAFRSYADKVENISFLATPQEVFEDEPSWSKLANVVGAGSSQVLAMGGMSRLIGAGATYGFFAGGGAGEIFNETLEQGGDVEQANTLAAANAGVTFAIDKILNPLPETIAKNAKLTSKKVAEEMLGAPLREAGSEVLQQMLAENLVRKVGLDDTQDLFEGLLESALGAFAGSAAVSGVAGGAYFADRGVYLAQQSLNEARRKIQLKGVTAEELNLYEKNMMALIEQKPEAFDKILGANLKENLRRMDLAARQLKNREERARKREDVKGFDAVYDEMYNRFLPVLGDENKAKAAARMFEANAVSLYEQNPDFSPRQLIDKMLPKVKRADAAAFLAQKMPEQAVSFSLIGINAKNADTNLLTRAMEMYENNADPVKIWQYTGWHLGGDGRWRMEISDKNAYIKNIDKLDLNEGVIDLLHDHKIEMERIKAYLAAALRNSAVKGFGHFYDDFYDFLLKHDIAENLQIGTEPENGGINQSTQSKPGLFEVINEADRATREIEDAMLADVFQKYLEMHPEKKSDATYDELIADIDKEYSKTYDFTEEQYKYIMGVLEQRRRHKFFEKYWDERKGVQDNKNFQILAETVNFKYDDDPRYIQGLANVFHNAENKRAARLAELKRLKLGKYPYFFEDIDKDEAYGKYRLYQGDFSPDLSHENFYPSSYVAAYQPKTLSEKYLSQEKFQYMKDADKRLIAGYLDVEEKIYQVDKYLENAAEEYEKQRLRVGGTLRLTESLRFEDGSFNWDYVQKLRNARENLPKYLGDILEHPVLFENYPNLAEMKIHFTRLRDNETYHVYFDRENGYVLELDTARVDKQNLKEVLLKGVAFAIQDMEGFDYSLTEAQRRNFMNRQVFLASRNLEDQVLVNMHEYVNHYLPGVDPEKFQKAYSLPVALMGFTQSRSTDEGAADKPKRKSFYGVDYDKLYNAVRKKYKVGQNGGDEHIKHLALMDLQQIQRRNISMIMAESRAEGGYSAMGMPWTGVTSQGAMDARALVRRMDYSDAKLKERPFFETNRDLKAVRDGAKQSNENEKFYIPDVMDPYDEFAKNISMDERNYRKTLEVLAKGAYDSADRTITLFETADADTIVHETFHYFWDLMEKAEYRGESHAANFHEVMSQLRENFVRNYVVKEFDGKWYALHKDTDMIMDLLPRGFENKTDVIDAGVRELFVAQFMKILDKKSLSSSMGTITDAADFYRQWLKTVANSLNIDWFKASPGGKKLLTFLKNKFK